MGRMNLMVNKSRNLVLRKISDSIVDLDGDRVEGLPVEDGAELAPLRLAGLLDNVALHLLRAALNRDVRVDR